MTAVNHAEVTSSDFFEAKYRQQADPWNFAASAYELGRYKATVAALAGQRYARGLEPGCSIGILTERLAPLCDRLDAFDFSATAVEQARQRCARLPQVQLHCGALSAAQCFSSYDLIVLSEIGYYFTPAQWRELTGAIAFAAKPGTTLLAVHWLGTSVDHCMNGEEVHEILRGQPLVQLDHSERHQAFRLDRWRRR
jgi:SAM-dependent methyltransferase